MPSRHKYSIGNDLRSTKCNSFLFFWYLIQFEFAFIRSKIELICARRGTTKGFQSCCQPINLMLCIRSNCLLYETLGVFKIVKFPEYLRPYPAVIKVIFGQQMLPAVETFWFYLQKWPRINIKMLQFYSTPILNVLFRIFIAKDLDLSCIEHEFPSGYSLSDCP